MNVVCDFTFQELFDRSELLSEAIEVLMYEKIQLSGTQQAINQLEGKKAAIGLLERLSEEQATFSPKLDVRRLCVDDYNNCELEPSVDVSDKFKRYDFYKVRIPITLFPKSGWAFTRVECWIEFCPAEEAVDLRPVVYDLFPHDKWAKIISASPKLSLGLDTSLRFQAETKGVDILGNQIDGALSTNIEAGAGLVLGPYEYTIRRANIRTRGRLNVEAFWRLDGREHTDEEDICLEVVLMTPKRRKVVMHARGELRAYHDFQVWTADIFKDWLPHFGKALRSMLGNGIPVISTTKWPNLSL